MNPVTVLVPTLRRPESLARALASVFVQDRAAELIQAIVVVDNSPEGSARATVKALRAQAPVPLLYVHEPHPGVATARNAGLARTSSRYVAFLDDDEEAPPHWLSALVETHERFQAEVTFGPVKGVVAHQSPSARAYLERFFSRLGPNVSGVTETAYGCGNSLMTRATVLCGAEPFDTAADQTGGEDDRLFTDLKRRNARFAWAADAFVYEHPPAHRATLRYAWTRAFGYGQSPSQMCWRARNWPGLAFWMAVGVTQAALYGTVAAVLFASGRPSRHQWVDRAAQGLGKVFWGGFLHFYGQAEAARVRPPEVSNPAAAAGQPPASPAVAAARSEGGASGGSDSRTATAANSTQTRSFQTSATLSVSETSA